MAIPNLRYSKHIIVSKMRQPNENMMENVCHLSWFDWILFKNVPPGAYFSFGSFISMAYGYEYIVRISCDMNT